MEKHNHIVYILKCKDNTLYTGYTIDLENRLEMHESGKGAKYTRGRGPFEVMFVEHHSTKEKALQKEYAIKQLSRKEKQHLIRNQSKEVIHNEDTKEL